MLARVARLWHTLRYLKVNQIAFYAVRRYLPAKPVHYEGEVIANTGFTLQQPICNDAPVDSPFSFTWLSQSRHFEQCDVDWHCGDMPRLWFYNLHYFDYLRDSQRPLDARRALLSSWLGAERDGSQPVLEPFPLSLRAVNWIHFLVADREMDAALRERLHASLYRQLLWLERNDERHILANHYFENLKALLFGAAYFQGEDAARWSAAVERELLLQLEEQFLEDGGHYERSPQYHALMLENLLDLCNLAASNPGSVSPPLAELLQRKARKALSWMEKVVFPDGEIPLFNDSAFGIAPTLGQLQDYASRVLEEPIPVTRLADRPRCIDLAASGLFGASHGQDMLLMDAGDIGPAYQPGHTHCDFLSYELMLGGHRLIVDSGVYGYEAQARRAEARSTRAHNTVVVDDLEQSEIWGEFRVARRARKLAGAAAVDAETCEISGAYKGFFTGSWSARPLFTHRRQISVKLSKDAFSAVRIADKIDGSGHHKVENLVHFHPSIKASLDGEQRVVLSRQDVPVARLEVDAGWALKLENSSYFPEFGVALENQCLVIEQSAQLPVESSYRITCLTA